ncbi:MAG: bifunctional metallophosphatase/5'-nucleotidase [Deltaproteobacteria bacterium]|nr:bifunctional metallophosphatase/5'-nucleotidase [Deltaproteobacteria bacterium]
MKSVKKWLATGFVIVLLFPCFVFGKEIHLTIIHTNDMHSHLLGLSPNLDYSPFKTGDDATLGGWARVATVIKSEKAKRTNPTLVVDAGDFLMGSFFHMISREEALELRLMKEMGYDVVTLGNHEFDLMPKGLARIITSAQQKGGIPEIVFSSAIFNQENPEDDTLEEIFKKGWVKPYTVKEIQGIRIGLFGIMGKDAAEVSPFARPVKFKNPIEISREIVKILREKEKVDLIICLSHGGLSEKKSRSEDELLAKEVPGIDIIVSGHTHTKLTQPLRVKETLIVQAYAHGRNVGVLDLAYEKGRLTLKQYALVEVDDRIQGDEKIQRAIESSISLIEQKILKEHGLTFQQGLAKTGFDLTLTTDESNLGNLIADSIQWAVNRIDYDPNDPVSKVVVAIESNGVIRDDLLKGKTGKVAVCDLFRIVPLGISRADDTMGYPIITCYLHGHEIKKILEVVTSIYPMKGRKFFLQVSGLKFKYNPNRMIFDRVTDIAIGSEEEGFRPLNYSESNKALYRIAANLYNATFISFVGRFTYGTLNIVPKDRKGTPLVSEGPIGNPFDLLLPLRVDENKEKPGIQELKQWIVLMDYVRSFPDKDGDGTPDIPDKYKGKLGRIVKEPSWNPIRLLSRGTYVTWIAFGAIVIILLIVGSVAYFVVRKVKRITQTKQAF